MLKYFDKYMVNYLLSKRKWHNIFPEPRRVEWKKEGFLSLDYCADCRLCCVVNAIRKPRALRFLPQHLHPNMENDFFIFNETYAYLDERGCKSLTKQGCHLAYDRRPTSCNLFPFVLIAGSLYLFSACPAVRLLPLSQWLALTENVTGYLTNYNEDDLRHLSMPFDAEMLKECFIFMHTTFFTNKIGTIYAHTHTH